MSFDCVIRGGAIISGRSGPGGGAIAADLGISGGRIEAIAPGLVPGRQGIDASGMLVLPGGVDSHVHIEQPSRGIARNADTFDSGTASAAVAAPPRSSLSWPRCRAACWPRRMRIMRRRPGHRASTMRST